MIEYEDVEKIKQIWKKVDDFDKQWLSTRGIFTQMHKAGMLDKEEYEIILREYDKMMAPVNNARDKAKAFVIDKAAKFGWDLLIEEKKKKKPKKKRKAKKKGKKKK
jgi:hypothetical protein